MVSSRLVVGLTGGIGCGKSVVAEELARLGAQVIDTDQISHALSRPPSPALQRIVDRFGPAFIAADGSMDRDRMRAHVFSDATARKALEDIFHPLIRLEIVHQLAEQIRGTPYSVLVVPLLFEAPTFLELTKQVLVVDCAPERQIERVKQRSRLSQTQIASIMAAQISREERLKRADAVIENNGTLLELHEQVCKFHLRCLQLAKGLQ
ncbi:dephospho-CoA kinase [Formivibrio citricus]|uniref:Dephospho-CoA kinase n=1 Tax=Formivibrio citricus TaxID=83765 RepID=A0A1I4ZP67_9NEIS|nr:dephospho-CoA kinase [Formivibrio citricus]SFN52061.1 dephospho-CoA kinase [Formivibrio citricus]